jgi:hypothetical protein
MKQWISDSTKRLISRLDYWSIVIVTVLLIGLIFVCCVVDGVAEACRALWSGVKEGYRESRDCWLDPDRRRSWKTL